MDVVDVVMCAGGASWELALVRGLGRPELGIRVARRCVDHGELLGIALRDLPTAVVVDSSLPWVDRDLVTTLRRVGVEVFAIGSSARPLDQIGVSCFSADVSAEVIATAVYGFSAPAASLASVDGVSASQAGRLVAAWGGAGAPGRTTVAIHLAIEAARTGTRTLLIDGDVWSASVAQTLELEESPSLAQAARFAGDGWPSPITDCVQNGPYGLHVLAGLARSELWPEVREESWRAVLAAAVVAYDLVVLDLAAPIEEDEELVFDRVPFRRNVVTTVALEQADEILLVATADPIGLRRAVVAHRTLGERRQSSDLDLRVVLNRVPRAGRRLQDCSRAVSEWFDVTPAAFLPEEPAFDRVIWEGRPLHAVASRSRWLRELRPVLEGLQA
jgi:ATPases involved in chromosome partitioning